MPIVTTPNDLENIADRISWEKNSSRSRIAKYWQILQYYSWQRLAARGIKVALRKFSPARIQLPTPRGSGAVSDWNSVHSEKLRRCIQIVAQDHGQRAGSCSTDVARGLFCLLNHEENLGQPIQWEKAERTPHLWRFQFQYHEFLLPGLRIANDIPQATWEFLDQWLVQYHDPSGTIDRSCDAWHPYCLSRRIPVWLWLLVAGSPPVALAQKLQRSLWQQVQYLAKNLETDIGGNHLLENYHAVLLSSVIWQNATSDQLTRNIAAKYEDDFLKLWQREMESQLTPAGEHFELSPMYHSHILANQLILSAAYQAVGRDVPTQLTNCVESMVSFLCHILQPDGEIPLFGDSGFGEALSLHSIRQLVELCELSWVDKPSTGDCGHYWTYRRQRDFLIVDMGPIAAPSLPAHGHCDTAGFEASIDGQRWFVDSGNFDYEDGSMRYYCRSSVAHNVVTLQRQNHGIVWSKFRMGKRSAVLDKKSGREGDSSGCNCRYRLASGHTLQRSFLCTADSWLCVDELGASQKTWKDLQVEGWLHLAPSLEVRPVTANCFELQRESARRYLHFFGCDAVELFWGWYCPAFGLRERSTVLGYPRSQGETRFGWVLTSSADNPLQQPDSLLLNYIHGNVGMFQPTS